MLRLPSFVWMVSAGPPFSCREFWPERPDERRHPRAATIVDGRCKLRIEKRQNAIERFDYRHLRSEFAESNAQLEAYIARADYYKSLRQRVERESLARRYHGPPKGRNGNAVATEPLARITCPR